MTGCFGNSFFDKSLENELMKHLEEEDTFICEWCGHECSIDDVYYDDDSELEQCPECEHWQAI